ncbi:hypothetical protein NL676_008650 [Syzygium grande]|nr:hypothetical protein NL676_008650 [Syzygium grande]
MIHNRCAPESPWVRRRWPLKQSNNGDVNGGRKQRSARNQDEECRERDGLRVHGHDHGVVEHVQRASLDFNLRETCFRSITNPKLGVATAESSIYLYHEQVLLETEPSFVISLRKTPSSQTRYLLHSAINGSATRKKARAKQE